LPSDALDGPSVPKLIRERLRQVESGTCDLAWLAGETMEDARITTVRHNQLRRPRQARSCGESQTPDPGPDSQRTCPRSPQHLPEAAERGQPGILLVIQEWDTMEKMGLS